MTTFVLDASATYDPDNGPTPLVYDWSVITDDEWADIAIQTPNEMVQT